jgi:uncharacterized protein HemX
METLKKIDIKTWLIIILGLALCISFWFGQKSHIDTHANEINMLHEENKKLLLKNDSLNAVNAKIDGVISDINKKIDNNTLALVTTTKELQAFKNKQNEIPAYVGHLSANGVSNAFTDYLSKSPNNH